VLCIDCKCSTCSALIANGICCSTPSIVTSQLTLPPNFSAHAHDSINFTHPPTLPPADQWTHGRPGSGRSRSRRLVLHGVAKISDNGETFGFASVRSCNTQRDQQGRDRFLGLPWPKVCPGCCQDVAKARPWCGRSTPCQRWLPSRDHERLARPNAHFTRLERRRPCPTQVRSIPH
jgi:hypothetical protein